MTNFLGIFSLALTAIYAFFTYRILRANQQTVNLIHRQAEQERHLRLREQFLSGITSVIQYDLQCPGCEQALRLFELLCASASQAHAANRIELLALLEVAQSQALRDGIAADQEKFSHAVAVLQELDRGEKHGHAWMSIVASHDRPDSNPHF